MAGPVGIEPTSTGLEPVILPLYQRPIFGAPGRTPTFDTRFRRPLLYATALRAHKRMGYRNLIFSHDCCFQNKLSPTAKRLSIRWYSTWELNPHFLDSKSSFSANWNSGAYIRDTETFLFSPTNWANFLTRKYWTRTNDRKIIFQLLQVSHYLVGAVGVEPTIRESHPDGFRIRSISQFWYAPMYKHKTQLGFSAFSVVCMVFPKGVEPILNGA